jgi:NAD(P)-dependent dehydrogenase (short-subunit alcohol dehydrogenase family)
MTYISVALRRQIEERAGNCCEYCRVHRTIERVADRERTLSLLIDPFRQSAAPMEIAQGILPFCLPEMAWVTGATLDVNGGVVMM